jgi:hypothetical protein
MCAQSAAALAGGQIAVARAALFAELQALISFAGVEGNAAANNELRAQR